MRRGGTADGRCGTALPALVSGSISPPHKRSRTDRLLFSALKKLGLLWIVEMVPANTLEIRLEGIYRASLPRFLRVATAITGDPELAADAVHDAS